MSSLDTRDLSEELILDSIATSNDANPIDSSNVDHVCGDESSNGFAAGSSMQAMIPAASIARSTPFRRRNRVKRSRCSGSPSPAWRPVSFSGDLGVRLNACTADWDRGISINSQDFFEFLAVFIDRHADLHRDSLTTSQEFCDFPAAFFAGCE